MKKFFKEFKAFISRGNIIDMAVGVIIGTAFSAIVTALTNKIIMPLINLALSGAGGLESAYTFLKVAYVNPEAPVAERVIDLANSIYIDWGAFITAIIDFLLIALVLFIILKIVMKSSEMLRGARESATKNMLTKEDKAELKKRGISRTDRAAVKVYIAERDAKAAEAKAQEEAAKAAAEEEAKKNTTEYLLKEIRDLLAENKELKKQAKK